METRTGLFVLVSRAGAQTLETLFDPYSFTSPVSGVMPYRLMAPEGAAPGERYPLLVVLHGLGGKGTDNLAQLGLGKPQLDAYVRANFKSYTVLPQGSDGDFQSFSLWGDPSQKIMAAEPTGSGRMALELVDHLIATYPDIDPSRVYLVGEEFGARDTCEVWLKTQPADDVVVTPLPDAQVAVSPASLTFTPADWATPQVVTVSAVNDAVSEGVHGAVIDHASASADPACDGLLIQDLGVTVQEGEASVRFAVVDWQVAETDGSVALTVELAGVVSGAVSVDYATVASGAAAPGSDFTAGTDPNNATSRFAGWHVLLPGGGLAIAFPTIPGREYAVEASDSLSPSAEWVEVQPWTPGTGETMHLPVADPALRRFHRVKARMP